MEITLGKIYTEGDLLLPPQVIFILVIEERP